MIEELKLEPIDSKLGIFVSSRIVECKEERTVAKTAISSINHTPILFEHLGARSISPRNLYLSHLNSSHFMVAVYKDGYGYIDEKGGMEISGLEDEIRFAQKHGINTLIYVHKDQSNRDQRLKDLIDEISPDYTLFFYNEPESLKNRMRDDLTAEISKLVVEQTVLRRSQISEAEKALNRANISESNKILRLTELDDFSQVVDVSHIVFLQGEAGVGKTTLMAEYAVEKKLQYIDLNGLSPKEIYVEILINLGAENFSAAQLQKLDSAKLALASLWSSLQLITLFIDHCDYVDELLEALFLGGGFNSAKRIVFSCREAINPSKIDENIKVGFYELSGLCQELDNLGELRRKLFLKSPKSESTSSPNQLDDNEINELAWLLCLTDKPVGVETLLSAFSNSEANVEWLYSQIEPISDFVSDSHAGLMLADDTLHTFLLERLKSTPQRLGFYASRLSNALGDSKEYRLAYLVARHIGENAEHKFATRALREATVNADWRIGLSIAHKLLDQAKSDDNKTDTFNMYLSLVYPLEIVGQKGKADEVLQKASEIASELDESASLYLEEIKLASNARRLLRNEDIEGLIEIASQYSANGDEWSQARILLELSALYIASKNYEEAIKTSNEAKEIFFETDDQYGLELSLRNLASALSHDLTNQSQLDEVLLELKSVAASDDSSGRNRAWKCNLLTRKYRNSGKPEEAKKTATEAIEIAKELGDENLHALNLINLGNVYRDLEQNDDALKIYSEAGVLAQKCGRNDLEADSSRLSAEIFNEAEQGQPDFKEKKCKASAFATHAIALLQDSVHFDGLARAYIELAEAEYDLEDKQKSAQSYFDAAALFAEINDEVCEDRALIYGAEIALGEHPAFYLENLFGYLNLEAKHDKSPADFFIESLGEIILRVPKKTIVPLLLLHVGAILKDIPEALIAAFVEASIDMVSVAQNQVDPIRLMLSSVAVAPMLYADPLGTNRVKLSESISRNIAGVSYRDLNAQGDIWTLEFGHSPIAIITVESLDHSNASSVAAILVALFLKAFEREILDSVAPNFESQEIGIEVAAFSNMPPDIQEMMLTLAGKEHRLDEDGFLIGRVESATGLTPIYVFLSDSFLEKIKLGENQVGTNQHLCARILFEISYLLTDGQIDEETLTRAISKIIRNIL